MLTPLRRLCIIGIGAGDPDYLTVQAVAALRHTDVFFIPDKGEGASDLRHLRREICQRYLPDGSYRLVEVRDPPRDRAAPAYGRAVRQWHEERAARWAEQLASELTEGQRGAFLAWGDPAFYDSTLRILQAIQAGGTLALELEVIPGISAVQALAARHQVSLTQIGGSLAVTTGRRLASDGWPSGADDVVVMLDGQCAFRDLDGSLQIFWGAYLGTADEILVSGTIAERAEEIQRVRAAARADKGWIFDTYLLRRAP